MAWTDQCKVAFSTNAKALQLKQSGRKNISKILKQLAVESGIPWKTLYHWWNEQENLKIQNHKETPENNTENPQAQTAESAEIPICTRCNKNKVYIMSDTKKPLSPQSKYFGLCGTCREKHYEIVVSDKEASAENGIMAVCPECSHAFYINKKRVGGNHNGSL